MWWLEIIVTRQDAITAVYFKSIFIVVRICLCLEELKKKKGNFSKDITVKSQYDGPVQAVHFL